MAWGIKFRPSAIKELEKLPGEVRERVVSYLESLSTGPRSRGKMLRFGKNDPPMRRYRVGDYRIICYLRDEEKIILVLRVGHRKDVYR